MTRFSQSKKLFDARIEKRVPTSVPVYLASLEDPVLVSERLRKMSAPTVRV